MAPKPQQTVIDEIAAHINKQGGSRSAWYVGITSDIAQRLHGDHNVPRESAWFIYRESDSAAEARAIEKAFIDWGCDGGSGGGDNTSRFVYAYLKTATTNP